MVRSKEEILASLKSIIVENNSDEVITLLEDVSDSMSVDNYALNQRVAELEQKCVDVETEWRNRYRDRFYGDVEGDDTATFKGEPPEKNQLTYDNLFKEE